MMFQPGEMGIAQAIRAWRARRYDETRPGWSVERFASVLGYAESLNLSGMGGKRMPSPPLD